METQTQDIVLKQTKKPFVIPAAAPCPIYEGRVYESTQYDAIREYDINRERNPQAVERIRESMRENKIIAPILLNESLHIIDGQHRWEAARLEGLPFHFIVRSGLTYEDIPLYNIHSSNWKFEDFAKSYNKVGMENYMFLDAYKERHKISLGQALHFLTGLSDYHSRKTKTGNRQRDTFTDLFMTGGFEINHAYDPDEKIVGKFSELLRTLELVDPVKNERYTKNTVIAASFMKMCAHPQYIHERLIKNLKEKRQPAFHEYLRELSSPLERHTIGFFLVKFQDLYNFSYPVNIDFSKIPAVK